MIRLPSLLIFIFINTLIFAQSNQVKIYSSASYDNGSALKINYKTINFKQELLLNLKIIDEKKKLFSQKDSLFCPKGISNYSLLFNEFIDHQDTNILNLKWFNLADELIKSEIVVLLPKFSSVKLIHTDTSLVFFADSSDYFSASLLIQDSTRQKHQIQFNKDTSLFIKDLVLDDPLHKRIIISEINPKYGNDQIDTFYYKAGKIKRSIVNELEVDSITNMDAKQKWFNGDVYLENNAFSSTPEHATGLMYPNSLIRINSTVDAFGLPLRLNFSHNTSDVLNPDFRNFFSIGLDINSLKEKAKNEIITERSEGLYNLKEIQPNINAQKLAIERLQETRTLLVQYPDNKYSIDSLFSKEIESLNAQERIDSTIKSQDSISGIIPDTSLSVINADSILSRKDSINQQISQIDELIERHQKSIDSKRAFLEKQRSFPNDLDQQFPSDDLYQYYDGNPLTKVLLRFNKLQLGNFYEYAGKYSIRDVELFGLNAAFKLNPNNSIHFLTGKINDFQSFNLDNSANINKRITSVAFSNSTYDYLNTSLRLSYSSETTTDVELPSERGNYVLSAGFNGIVGGQVNYELDINKSGAQIDQSYIDDENIFQNAAIHANTSFSPMKQLELKLRFDQVGSNYFSDGVYFLRRNIQEIGFASKIRLFKNKIILKSEYALLERNIEQDDVSNETDRWFFDLSSRFKRLPNFQVIHSPITVEIANKLDTSFSNLNAFSTISLYRLFYLKRVKRTYINVTTLYSEITNDVFDRSYKQQSSQFMAAISNKKMSLSATASFFDLFNQFRFVSLNYSQHFSYKFRNTIYASKNMNSNPIYEWIIRNKIDYTFHKSMTVGAGGILLVGKHQNQVGSTVSLNYRF